MPQVFAGIRDGVPGVERDLRRMVEKPDFVAESPRQIADLLLHTAYMGTEHSGEETRGRAADLAKEVSAFWTAPGFHTRCSLQALAAYRQLACSLTPAS